MNEYIKYKDYIESKLDSVIKMDELSFAMFIVVVSKLFCLRYKLQLNYSVAKIGEILGKVIDNNLNRKQVEFVCKVIVVGNALSYSFLSDDTRIVLIKWYSNRENLVEYLKSIISIL